MKRALVLISIAAVILAACAGVPSQSEELREYAVIPLARFVLPEDHDSKDALARIQDGTFAFNEQYRKPDLPRDRVPVRCDETDRIGVTFELRRRNRHSGRAVTVRETWTHSAVNNENDELDQTRRIGLESGREARLMNVSLNLTPTFKVDGVWALRLAIDDEVLFRDSFELIGCSATPSVKAESVNRDPNDWFKNDYAPLWKENPWGRLYDIAEFYNEMITVHRPRGAVPVVGSRLWLSQLIDGWRSEGWANSVLVGYQSDRLNPSTVLFKAKWLDLFADGSEEFSCGWYIADLIQDRWLFMEYAEIECEDHNL